MGGRALDELLEMLGSRAAADGMPTYAELQGRLEAARASGDLPQEASIGYQIGTWLQSVGSVASARDELAVDPIEILELAAEHLARSAQAAARGGDHAQQRLSTYQSGHILYELNRFNSADRTLREALAIPAEHKNLAVEYSMVRDLGDCAMALGEYSAALEQYSSALALARDLGDPYEEAEQHGKIAASLEQMNRYDEAITEYAQSRDLFAETDRNPQLREQITLHKHLIGATDIHRSVQYAKQRIEEARKKLARHQEVCALPFRLVVGYRHASHYLRTLALLGEQFADRTRSASAAGDFDQEGGQIRRGQVWSAGHVGELPLAARLCVDYALTGVSLRDVRTSAEGREAWVSNALDAARALGDAAAETELLVNSSWDCADRGRTDEAHRRIAMALELVAASGNRRMKGQALLSLGHLHNLKGQYQEALQAMTEGETLMTDGAAPREGRYAANFTIIYLNTGQHAKALEHARHDLEDARGRGDRHRELRALSNLGLIHHKLGEYDEALKCHQQASHLSREHGDKRSEGAAKGNEGVAWLELHRFAEATECFQKSIALGRELGDRASEESGLGNLGHVLQLTGRHEQAIESVNAALAIARERGHQVGEANAFYTLAKVHLDLRNHAEATRCAERSREIAHEIGYQSGEAGALMTLGVIAAAQGKHEDAVPALEQALAISRATGEKAAEAGVLQNLAIALALLNRHEDAATRARAAVEIFTSLGMTDSAQACEAVLQRVDPDGAYGAEQTNVYSLLFKWIRIPVVDVNDSENFLREHEQILLTEHAENILVQMSVRQPDNNDIRRHHKLLQNSRQQGIDATYADYGRHVLARALMEFEQWRQSPEGAQALNVIVEWIAQADKEDSKQFMRDHGEDLLTFNSSLALGLLAEKGPEPERSRDHRELLEACRKRGIDEAYEAFDSIYWHLPQLSVILKWLQSPTLEFLDAHQGELLIEEAEQVLHLLMRRQGNEGLAGLQNFIQLARRVGI